MMCLSGYARGAAININYNPYILVYGEASKGKSRTIETLISNECKPSSSTGNIVQAIGATLPGVESNLLDYLTKNLAKYFYCLMVAAIKRETPNQKTQMLY